MLYNFLLFPKKVMFWMNIKFQYIVSKISIYKQHECVGCYILLLYILSFLGHLILDTFTEHVISNKKTSPILELPVPQVLLFECLFQVGFSKFISDFYFPKNYFWIDCSSFHGVGKEKSFKILRQNAVLWQNAVLYFPGKFDLCDLLYELETWIKK